MQVRGRVRSDNKADRVRVVVLLGLMVTGADALPAVYFAPQQPSQEQPARKVVLADQQVGNDMGAQIAAADAALSTAPGEIKVAKSGQISSRIVLSPNHTLVCEGSQVTLTMSTAQASIIQSSDTVISGCTLSSSLTSLPASGGEIVSQGTSNVGIEKVRFMGGGDHIHYKQVSNFIIRDTVHHSITAQKASPIFVDESNHGQIISVHIGGFTVPAAPGPGVRLIGIHKSSFVDVSDPIIENVDASTVGGCGGVSFTTSTNSTLRGGQISGLKNCDGVLAEAGASDIDISGTSSVDQNASSGAGTNAGNGEGFDIFNSRDVRLSNVTARGNGLAPHGLQAGIEVSNSLNVSISNCMANGNGIEGIRVDGSLGVKINDSQTDHNGSSGIIVMPAIGMVNATHSSPVVIWTHGPAEMTFSRVWPPHTKIVVGGEVYVIESLQSTGQLTLTANFHGADGKYPYRVDSYAEITGGESLDNGQSSAGLPANEKADIREGVYFAGASGELTGRVTGLRATDTQSDKTQLYGIRVENRARIIADDNRVEGNMVGGIRDSPGHSQIHGERADQR